MKTDLAYIDEVANATAAAPVKAEHRISGFRFKDATEKLSRGAERYAVDREFLSKKLLKAGITPLAFVPTAWWRDVLDKSGLVTTTMADGGRVGFTRDQARDARDVVHGVMFAGVLLIEVLAFLGFTAWGYAHGLPLFSEVILPGQYEASPPALIFGLFGAIMTAIPTLALVSIFQRWTFKAVAWAVFNYMTSRREMLTKHMSFGGKDGGDTSDGVSCEYELPTPPQDAAETLLKLRRITMFGRGHWQNSSSDARDVCDHEVGIAAEAEAFSLKATPTQMLYRWRQDDIARIREERAWLAANDPIVYVTNGSAVAIVVQYGDFPIEKEVVDAAVKVEL